MSTITVVYARSHNIGGLLIRHADRWGRWSHCGIVSERNTVIEALAFKGVVETPVDDFFERYEAGRTAIVSIKCAEPEVGLLWAKAQIGKGYDYLAVLGSAIRESWQEPDRWMCSELVESTLAAAGNRRFRDGPARISPNLSYMVI